MKGWGTPEPEPGASGLLPPEPRSRLVLSRDFLLIMQRSGAEEEQIQAVKGRKGREKAGLRGAQGVRLSRDGNRQRQWLPGKLREGSADRVFKCMLLDAPVEEAICLDWFPRGTGWANILERSTVFVGELRNQNVPRESKGALLCQQRSI